MEITHKRITLLLLSIFLFTSCSHNSPQKEIIFIKKGNPLDLNIRAFDTSNTGYLEAEKRWSSLSSMNAIEGKDLQLEIDMSITDFDGFVIINFGPNSFSVVNNKGESGIFLQGASLGASKRIGEVSDHIKQGVNFNLIIKYFNEILTYSIDGNIIYTNKTNVPPSGVIKIKGEGSSYKLYNMTCKGGEPKSLEKFYNKKFLLDRAHRSVENAAKDLKDDPNRPGFHFQPPANWNNDPNGLIYHKGYYHLFYQHNPYADYWEWMHWGHARSKDLVNWEHLPIALWPSLEKGEAHCFSGSGFIKKDGSPVILYTSIATDWQPQQWMALPLDDDLIEWEKSSNNPIISLEDHGGKKFSSWRDPFLFEDNGKTYMVTGGHPSEGNGSIILYEALNNDLTKWKFLGVPFSGSEKNWECPNFFKIDDKYVIIYSPHDRVEYYTGKMDFEKIKFTPEHHGVVDYGSSNVDDVSALSFYAPNTLLKKDGRKILFGWVPGFKKNQGWNGAISLPRELSLDSGGRLIQKPVPELKILRGAQKQYSNINLGESPKKLEINFTQFEMLMNIESKGTKHIGIRLTKETGEPFEMSITPKEISIDGQRTSISDSLNSEINSVHLFFDNSIMEVFINGGRLCATKVIYPRRENLNFELYSYEKNIMVDSISLWEINKK